jgi:hypothetical protein
LIEQIFDELDVAKSKSLKKPQVYQLYGRLDFSKVSEQEFDRIVNQVFETASNNKEGDRVIHLEELWVIGRFLVEKGVELSSLVSGTISRENLAGEDTVFFQGEYIPMKDLTIEQLHQLKNIFDIVDGDGSGEIGKFVFFALKKFDRRPICEVDTFSKI